LKNCIQFCKKNYGFWVFFWKILFDISKFWNFVFSLLWAKIVLEVFLCLKLLLCWNLLCWATFVFATTQHICVMLLISTQILCDGFSCFHIILCCCNTINTQHKSYFEHKRYLNHSREPVGPCFLSKEWWVQIFKIRMMHAMQNRFDRLSAKSFLG
jgi:hypothetical protein